MLCCIRTKINVITGSKVTKTCGEFQNNIITVYDVHEMMDKPHKR
jgi:hypothetical protein